MLLEDRFKLKDSGKRRDFKSGAIRDLREGKGRYDLITPFGLRRLALVMEKGAKKYDDRNWEKGMEFSSLIDSAERHIEQFKMGLEDEDHLAQACFNLFAVIHFQELKRTDLDDMPHYLSEEKMMLISDGAYYWVDGYVKYYKKGEEIIGKEVRLHK